MTTHHQNRANGDSFFTEIDLNALVDILKKELKLLNNGQGLLVEFRAIVIEDLIEKISKELEYVSNIK